MSERGLGQMGDHRLRYVEALGGTLHVEVEYAGKRIELA
jgi:hypothetical protein